MRGSFNREMAVRYGPRSTAGPPGVTYALSIPSRRVPQIKISQGQFDFSLAGGWVTQDTVVLNPPAVTSPWLGAMFTDQLTADEVSFDDEPGVWYSVCRHEVVTPFVGPLYYRDLLIPVASVVVPPWLPPEPLPGPPVPGGLTYVAPGLDCGHPTVLTQFGDYLFTNQPNGFNGFYAMVIDPGESLTISHVGGLSTVMLNDVFTTSLHGDPCAGVFVDQLSPSGVPSTTIVAPGGGGATKVMISAVLLHLPPPLFVWQGLRLETP